MTSAVEWTDEITDAQRAEHLAAVHHADEETRDRLAELVGAERMRLKARALAADQLRQESADRAPRPPLVCLTDLLAQEDPPVRYRVDRVWPAGGRILLAAQYKAGKTTGMHNLVGSLVDADPFLGKFQVHPVAGQVVIIDNELDPDMMRRWLRAHGIRNTDQVHTLALRGRIGSFNILDPDIRAAWATDLRAIGTGVVILDCLRPLLDALGLSEDKEAGRLLTAFDALLHEAHVPEAAVIHHMGHSGERARGDSALRGWPDVEWQLLREKTDDAADDAPADARRYFKAYGRDVDEPEGLLTYDHDTRRLTLAGGSRKETKSAAGIPEILAYLEQHPGATQRGVEAALKDVLDGAKATRAALKEAIRRHLVDVTDGPNRSHLHFLTTPGAPGASAVRQTHPAHPGGECASAPIGAHGAPPPPPDPQQTLDLPAHSAPSSDACAVCDQRPATRTPDDQLAYCTSCRQRFTSTRTPRRTTDDTTPTDPSSVAGPGAGE